MHPQVHIPVKARIAMNKYLFYRISSRDNEKIRAKGFSKMACFENLLACFPDYKVVCLADNCDRSVVDRLRQRGLYRLVETSLGNSGSFGRLLNVELNSLAADDIVYFVEDDYLHTDDARERLEEGLRIFDYVTLYDHPDKYGAFLYEKNPFVPSGFLSEETQIYKGKTCIWRVTNSTTMTFACHAKTIMQDRRVWNLFTKDRKIPIDFYAWVALTWPRFRLMKINYRMYVVWAANVVRRWLGRRKRYLGVPLDSSSAHMLDTMLPENFDSKFSAGTHASAGQTAERSRT